MVKKIKLDIPPFHLYENPCNLFGKKYMLFGLRENGKKKGKDLFPANVYPKMFSPLNFIGC